MINVKIPAVPKVFACSTLREWTVMGRENSPPNMLRQLCLIITLRSFSFDFQPFFNLPDRIGNTTIMFEWRRQYIYIYIQNHLERTPRMQLSCTLFALPTGRSSLTSCHRSWKGCCRSASRRSLPSAPLKSVGVGALVNGHYPSDAFAGGKQSISVSGAQQSNVG